VPTRELFYTDPEVTLAFQSHVKALLGRTNIYTGRKYSDEPAIMAIELANEPHTSDHYECLVTGIGMKTIDDCKKETPNPKLRGALVATWLASSAAFIHANDKNHLVTSGEEGYRSSHQDPKCLDKNQWLHDGSKGVDFERNAAISGIDFLTNHLYPDNWNIQVADLDWFNTCVIVDRARIARANKKPLILEESGFNNQAYAGKTSDYVKDRPYSMSRVYRYSVAAGYQGLMVWQATEMISPTEIAKRDSMTFPIVAPQDDKRTYTAEGQVMVKAAECMNVFAGDLSRCVFLCATSVMVDSTGKGINPDGNICYRLAADATSPAFSATSNGTIATTSVAATQVGLASSTGAEAAGSTQTTAEIYPICPTSVVTKNGWGWTADQQLCQKSEKTIAQLLNSGHCSCTAAP
jgi:mannan endo-1,4-beta-mannosidase